MAPIVRVFRRVVVPVLSLIVGIGGFLAIRNWPRGDGEEAYFSVGSYAAVLIGFTLLALWALIARPIHRAVTVAIIALTSGAVVGGFASGAVQFDGDMHLLFQNPFRQHDSEIEAHRRTQSDEKSAKIALTPEAPTDVPAFRGRDRSGIFDGHLVTIEQRRENEVIACYDAQNGREVWAYSYPADFRETMGGEGPRATPTIHAGLVYSLGAMGDLVCLDGSDGSKKWHINILEGNKNLHWGMSGSPLVFDDLVVVNPGIQIGTATNGGVRAYHRLTGELVWKTGQAKAGYSSPMLAELDGVRQILMFDGVGVAGYSPSSGTLFWRFDWPTHQNINVAQPVIVGPKTFVIASGYGTGAAMVEVWQDEQSWKTRQVWRTKFTVMRCKFSSPVKWEECLIGLNDGILECVDLRDGRSLWKDDRRARRGEAYGHGQLLRTGDSIIVLTEYGEIVLVEANRESLVERGRVQALGGLKTWNTPTLADGRLYVRNADEMACYDLRP